MSEVRTNYGEEIEDKSDEVDNISTRLNQLFQDTLCHETYCPLFLQFFGTKFIVKTIVLISKFHNKLVLNHPQSLSLCRSIAYNDFGSFLTLSPYAEQFSYPSVTNPQALISKLYMNLPALFLKSEQTVIAGRRRGADVKYHS